MKFKIAVCDDIPFFVDAIKEYVEEYANSERKDIDVSAYSDGNSLMEDIKEQKYHIIFLDVEMPGLDGIETAKRIRQFNMDVILIFVTSHENFSLQATHVEAIDYIVKPVYKERLFRVLKKGLILAEALVEQKEQELRTLEVVLDYEHLSIDIFKITYMQKCRNQVQIVMDNAKEYFVYGTIKEMMTLLPSNRFFRISNNMLVNIAHVREVSSYQTKIIVAGSQKMFPVGRSYYSAFKKEFMNYRKR